MMKRILILLVSISLTTCVQAQLTVEATNSTPLSRKNVPVVIDIRNQSDVMAATVEVAGNEIPAQLDDLNHDGQYDELSFLIDVPAYTSLTAHVSLYNIIRCNGSPSDTTRKTTSYPARTYAEMMLRNPKVKEKNRHDIYLTELTADGSMGDTYLVQHHHGVAFENELIGVRIYFDRRQTLDLYGKFQPRLELHQTQFYTTAEQKAAGYGDDVLWVGNSFGLGALRGWDGEKPTMIDPVVARSQRILAQGPVRCIVEVEDRGWQQRQKDGQIANRPVNMTLRYTLYAGHRDIEVEGRFNRSVKKEHFSTGIINVKGSDELTDNDGLRGCWGTDWPASDTINWKRETVGLGIFVPAECLEQELEADPVNYSYIVKANPQDNVLRYYLAYTSANESFGPGNKERWFEWLRRWKKELSTPVKIKIRGL